MARRRREPPQQRRPTGRPRGQPTKLTKATREKLCKAIRLGATYKLACAYAGISYSAFRLWINEGKANTAPRYVRFLKQIEEAEAEGAVTWLDVIEKAAKEGTWQAAAYKLDRRIAGYAPRQEIDLNSTRSPLVEMLLNGHENGTGNGDAPAPSPGRAAVHEDD
jgi:hypothetical protein